MEDLVKILNEQRKIISDRLLNTKKYSNYDTMNMLYFINIFLEILEVTPEEIKTKNLCQVFYSSGYHEFLEMTEEEAYNKNLNFDVSSIIKGDDKIE